MDLALLLAQAKPPQIQIPAGGGGGILAAIAAAGIVVIIIELLILALVIASLWVIFSKAGEPGWAAIIPIYNLIVLFKISGKPAWWAVFVICAPVLFIMLIIAYIGLAANFGKGGGFAVGLILLPMVFLPILAFGSAKYNPVSVDGGGARRSRRDDDDDYDDRPRRRSSRDD